ncbi:hypothetical protein [Hugenholtzia roseola]|uniref:hypothetical protein n=1 Tax=Hugenholtzia roseola TaxID=1002 RepID=UPI000409CF71|nr:hypothetical protein [Hugenholtzia roseola]
MTNEKPLFRTFLQSPQQYGRLEAWWKKQFVAYFPDCPDCKINWHKAQYANGTPLRDGNPIFTVYIPKIGKNIRIVQEALEDEQDIHLDTWTDKKYYQDKLVPELVIALTLTKETAKEAFACMAEWQRGQFQQV